jgi:hypothetical protein
MIDSSVKAKKQVQVFDRRIAETEQRKERQDPQARRWKKEEEKNMNGSGRKKKKRRKGQQRQRGRSA